MTDDATLPPPQRHAFNHAPAALRIFRFAADTAPRVLQLAHVSAFLRECAVEFGSADATLPGAMRSEYAAKRYLALRAAVERYFKLRAVVERNAARCPWLAAKVLACRSGAPMPAAALAPDVTRHDVNWGAEGARRHALLRATHGGFGLTRNDGQHEFPAVCWAQGPVGATSGKHYFQVSITMGCNVSVGWVDGKLRFDHDEENGPGDANSAASGATLQLNGCFLFSTAPISKDQLKCAPSVECPCAFGCLLDVDAGAMTVFADGEALPVQCNYTFPMDGRAWYPSVALAFENDALFSNVL
jgi:hypothetical protein